VFSLWWAYFKHPADVDRDRPIGAVFVWGYGHYLVFAALAALGAGLQVAADITHQTTPLAPSGIALTVAVPLVVYLATTAVLHRRSTSLRLLAPIPVAAFLVLAVALAATAIGVPSAIVLMGFVVAGLVAFNVVAMHREAEATPNAV
jgi:low temperature requirement protein LtrA